MICVCLMYVWCMSIWSIYIYIWCNFLQKKWIMWLAIEFPLVHFGTKIQRPVPFYQCPIHIESLSNIWGIPDGHHDPRHLGCHKSLASSLHGVLKHRVTEFRIDMGVNPKIMGKPSNHPFVHRVFHYFHHPFWVPLFLETSIWNWLNSTHVRHYCLRKTRRKRTETEALTKKCKTENSHDSLEVDQRLEIDHVSTPSLHLSTGPKAVLKRIQISQWIVQYHHDITVTHPINFFVLIFCN